MELVFGTTPEKSYKFTLADGKNNLNGLAEAINNLKAGVAATVLNTGTGDTPCYLSLTALASGATKLQLRSTPGSQDSNVLTSSNQGADAVFKLNGKEVRKPDNVISPGRRRTGRLPARGRPVTSDLRACGRPPLAFFTSGVQQSRRATQHQADRRHPAQGEFVAELFHNTVLSRLFSSVQFPVFVVGFF